jgi:hypothetical protein
MTPARFDASHRELRETDRPNYLGDRLAGFAEAERRVILAQTLVTAVLPMS